MLTVEEVFETECELLKSVSEEYKKDYDGEKYPDDEERWNAFEAAQTLRKYLQKKEAVTDAGKQGHRKKAV